MNEKKTRIKTILATSVEDFDNRVNAFCSVKDVFATQTHVGEPLGEGDSRKFIAVCFYRE